MGTVDIFLSKSGRFCCSYFYAGIISKRRKSRHKSGISANQTRRLPLTADQLSHRIRKGLPDVVCTWLLVEAAICLWHHDTICVTNDTFAKTEDDDGIKFHNTLQYLKGIQFHNFESKKKTYRKTSFWNYIPQMHCHRFRNYIPKDQYIFSFFIFKIIFEIQAGHCPPAVVHLCRCTNN